MPTKKHNPGKHNDQLFRQHFREGFQRQHNNGIAQGAYAMCKVIHDKAVNTDIAEEERLQWIIAFTSTMLNYKPAEETEGQQKVQPDVRDAGVVEVVSREAKEKE